MMKLKHIKMQHNKHKKRKNCTQPRQNIDSLPQIISPSRLISLGNQIQMPVQKIKNKKIKHSVKFPNQQLISYRKLIDENYHSIPLKGKSSIKYTKKKQERNNYIIVQPIKRNIFKDKIKPPTISSFESDTYQGIRQYNQDRISINSQIVLDQQVYSFFAVYDGHGGSNVSDFLKYTIAKQFQKLIMNKQTNILQNLYRILKSVQIRILEGYNSKFSGGSCVSILVIHKYNYYIANIGDSRIIRVHFNKQQKCNIQQLTTDHKPQNPLQKKRIQKQGGKVYQSFSRVVGMKQQIKGPFRVFPGKLSVSRTIGDATIKKHSYGSSISSQPQLKKGQINGKQLFLLMTDGAYQKFSNQQIVFFFTKKQCSLNLKRGIQSFLIQSMIRQTCDNISLISVLTK